MNSNDVPLPAEVTIPITIRYGRDAGQLWAEAEVNTPEGRLRARMHPPRGVPELYGKRADIERWLYSTACNAVRELLMGVLPHTERFKAIAEYQNELALGRVRAAGEKAADDALDELGFP